MPQQLHLPRILGLLAAIICTGATLAIAAQATPPKHGDAPEASGNIILTMAVPGDSSEEGQMPPVVFDHDLHTRGDKNGETCAACHEPSSQNFRLPAGEGEDAWHTGCVSCHQETKTRGIKTGPLQAECRTCHDAAALPPAKKARTADGGMDAALHARHIASLAANGGEVCASCHHPVKEPVSPTLEADSCRSCHPASPQQREAEASNRPLFADVAHQKCISCHQELAAKGEATALTCASCHDAKIKAGYAKPSPLPRLEAGQPDAVMMRAPQATVKTPGSMPAPSPDVKSAMPPVVFDHKRHEAAAENCSSCHHNTLQSCSTCHTPQGDPKGGNVSWPKAMHMPDSSRSCVGCHESRKTVTPQCAGCHGGMPAKEQPDCATCHQPLTGGKASSTDSPAPSSASGMPVAPSVPVAEYAAMQKALETRAKMPAPDFSNVPEKLSLGLLSDKFEPAVFPHRAIVEKLAAGIKEAAPGMAWFHASPESLCASCHHNAPSGGQLNATMRCASCHTGSPAKGSAPPDGPPQLKIAYHQQCMSCHTRMDVAPAATDCAGCHAPRQKTATTEGGR